MLELVSQRPSFQNWQSRRLHMKLRLQPFNRNSTNYNLNAKEQGKQHIELQKQHPELAGQALAHLRQQPCNRHNGSSRINTRRNSRCCSRPKARTKPKAGTCTKCSLIKCARARQPAHRIAEICHWFFASQTALCFHLVISFWRHGLAWLGSHGG